MTRTSWIVGALVLLLLPAAASAHDTRPLYVEISERDGQVFSVMWKVPITVAVTNVPDIRLPESCDAVAPPTGGKTTRRQTYRCATDLSNDAVSIHYPRYNPSISSLIHFTRLSGETYSVVLSPDKSVWQIPEKEQIWKIAREYMALGIKHIWQGYDHLLFIVCLVLLSGTFKRILVTVTGFTVAHSITLALAALEVVKVSVAPVEASIALSIVFVAMELARDKRHTLTWRYPIAVSSTFGLLHGFGFAAVLTEIGLPQTEIPTALLFFNIGVEIGQIAFVIAAIALFFAGKRVAPVLRDMTFDQVLGRTQRPAAYIVGVLALFWTIDRVAAFYA
ncbi:MAG: HupE/UreJ family protein [Rhodospirillales bacterium]|nr:MAG: HupE/UreJ family protein [Rhodospirillales bacterium]